MLKFVILSFHVAGFICIALRMQNAKLNALSMCWRHMHHEGNAFRACMQHARFGACHIERIALEGFNGGLDKCVDENMVNVLTICQYLSARSFRNGTACRVFAAFILGPARAVYLPAPDGMMFFISSVSSLDETAFLP